MFNFIDFKKLTTTALLGVLMAGNLIIPSTSAQDSNPDEITLTGTVRDFEADHPDFERSPGEQSADGSTFGYGLDRDITTDTLGLDRKPVYAGGSYSTTNQTNFDQWYRDIANVNQSKEFGITLTKQANGVYRYSNTDFFPINGELFGNYRNNKNFHFTYELHTRFTYNGGEVFNFRGDDDVWVYINGKKVIDIGGVHGATNANVSLDDVANEIGLETGKSYTLDFFFAERHTTQSNLIIETTLELETVPEVGGTNACVLDWSEVLAADPDGWVTDSGSNGDRDDLHRVYYHQPSGKYIKVTVDQRWGWGGANGPDPYAYSPKIVDYSKWGTGGFDGEDMFLFSVKPHDDQVNNLTLEFYNDSELTDKADVSNLNFTLTDLDGAGGGAGRENIIVSAEDSFGSAVPLEFYRPEGSVIQDAWINGGNVLGKPGGITGPEGNIAPVLLGDTHKVEIAYQLAPGAAERDGIRHMYVSDLAWCGEVVNVTPEEEVEIPDPTTPPTDPEDESGDDDGGDDGDFDKNGIPDSAETDTDVDGNGIKDFQDPDDDGDGIPDVVELYTPDRIDLESLNDVTYYDANGAEVGTVSLPVAPVTDLLPINALNSYTTTAADYQNPDSDGDFISDADESGDSDLTTPPRKTDEDDKPDYLDLDSDNDNISDADEAGDSDLTTPPNNFDGDSKPNYIDRDSDNDKIKDEHEAGDNRLDTAPINTDELISGGDDNPDYLDLDSDADSISDRIEAGDDSLETPPINSDNINDGNDSDTLPTSNDLGFPYYNDHTPNYRDLDSDDNGILDADEISGSVDTDEQDNYIDLDDDGDGIADVIEIGANPASPTSSDLTRDNDGIPDYQDTDSDNDSIPDSIEGVSNGTGTKEVRVIAPAEVGTDGTIVAPNFATVNLKDSSDAGTVEGSANTNAVTISEYLSNGTPTEDGRVDITGTPKKFDYQTYTYSD